MDKLVFGQGTIFENGYGMIPRKVMQDKKLTIEAKAIYSYLMSYAGTWDTAYPSVELIISHLQIDKKRFYRHIKLLTEHGYITIVKNKEKGRFKNNVYKIVNSPCTHFAYTVNSTTNSNNLISNNENDNGLLSQPISLPFQYPKVTSCISYYLKRYREVFGEKHPELKTKQWERVAKEIHSAAEEFCLDIDDLENMVNAFLKSPIDTDFNINHFATEGILTNRIYEVAY